MMKRSVIALMLVLAAGVAAAGDFERDFLDATVRVDVSMSSHDGYDWIQVDSMAQWPGWYGRRVNLRHALSPAALEVAVIDAANGDTLYTDAKYFAGAWENVSYSTLFVPQPRRAARVKVSLFDYTKTGWIPVCATERSLPPPTKHNQAKQNTYRELRRAADPSRAITLAIVAEGYRAEDMPAFLKRAAQLDSVLFTHEAFGAYADRFTTVAVQVESVDSGISRPSKGIVKNTALRAHFDSFALDRLITIPEIRPMWDALEGVPAQFVFILANTSTYGGSGPYNEYAIGSAGNPWWGEIIVHEFGHTFANLGDEYEEGYDLSYTPDFEPEEPNITTLYQKPCKWQHLIDAGKATLIEGAGYQATGVWRGAENCLMRAVGDKLFCPVCTDAIQSTIRFYTEDL